MQAHRAHAAVRDAQRARRLQADIEMLRRMGFGVVLFLVLLSSAAAVALTGTCVLWGTDPGTKANLWDRPRLQDNDGRANAIHDTVVMNHPQPTLILLCRTFGTAECVCLDSV